MVRPSLGCTYIVFELTGFLANALTILDHIRLARHIPAGAPTSQLITPLYLPFPLMPRHYALTAGMLGMYGLISVGVFWWDQLERKRLALQWILLGWLSLQTVACAFPVLLYWLVFEETLTMIVPSNMPFGTFPTLLMLAIATSGVISFPIYRTWSAPLHS